MGALCLLILPEFFLVTMLCRGCPFGSIAIRTSALWSHLSMVSGAGKRNALASRASVGEEHNPPPVTAREPILWTNVSCLITLTALVVLSLAWSIRLHQTSTVYRILGIATLMYSLLAYLGVIPHIDLVRCFICDAQLVPLPITWACCVFQLRF